MFIFVVGIIQADWSMKAKFYGACLMIEISTLVTTIKWIGLPRINSNCMHNQRYHEIVWTLVIVLYAKSFFSIKKARSKYWWFII